MLIHTCKLLMVLKSHQLILSFLVDCFAVTGHPFDYFGIGLFASCYSIPNDFGVQLLFFKYKHASMVGGATLKIGDGVASVTTTKEWNLPTLRCTCKEITNPNLMNAFLICK